MGLIRHIKDSYAEASDRDFFAMAIGAVVAVFVCEVMVLIGTGGDIKTAAAVAGVSGPLTAAFSAAGYRRRGR